MFLGKRLFGLGIGAALLAALASPYLLLAALAAPHLLVAAPRLGFRAAFSDSLSHLCTTSMPEPSADADRSLKVEATAGGVRVGLKLRDAQPGEWYAVQLVDQSDCSPAGVRVLMKARPDGVGRARFDTPASSGDGRGLALLVYDLDITDPATRHFVGGGVIDIPDLHQRKLVLDEAARVPSPRQLAGRTGQPR